MVPSDRQGRIIPAELDCALDLALGAGEDGPPVPALVCLQAGNLHSGAFDPFTEAIAVAKAHGAWVHVDGAFGLWAAAVPELSRRARGVPVWAALKSLGREGVASQVRTLVQRAAEIGRQLSCRDLRPDMACPLALEPPARVPRSGLEGIPVTFLAC